MSFIEKLKQYTIVKRQVLDELNNKVSLLINSNAKLLEENISFKQSLINKEKQNVLEEKFNNKYPKIEKLYAGRYIYNNANIINIDLRNFFNEYDCRVKKIVDSIIKEGMSDDDKALVCLEWVRKNIKYSYDINNQNVEEFWQYAHETLELKKGDCEDMTILLMNMMLIARIPYWKIRPTCSNVNDPFTKQVSGHCFVTYECEEKDFWVLLDACYYPNNLLIKERKNYKDEENYSDVWFSWNQKYCFASGTKNLKYFEN